MSRGAQLAEVPFVSGTDRQPCAVRQLERQPEGRLYRRVILLRFEEAGKVGHRPGRIARAAAERTHPPTLVRVEVELPAQALTGIELLGGQRQARANHQRARLRTPRASTQHLHQRCRLPGGDPPGTAKPHVCCACQFLARIREIVVCLRQMKCLETLLGVVQEDHGRWNTEVTNSLLDRLSQVPPTKRVVVAVADREVADLRRDGEFVDELARGRCQLTMPIERLVVERGVDVRDPETQSVLKQLVTGTSPVKAECNASVSSAHNPSFMKVSASGVASTPVNSVTRSSETG